MSSVVSVLALDIGEVRTGIAKANNIARIASPLTVLYGTDQLAEEVGNLINEHGSVALVVGMPRNLSGESTAQTNFVREMAENIKQHIEIPVYFIDEAVTSAQAEEELKARKRPYRKEDIDMLSAVYILEDFLREYPEVI